MQLRAGVLIGLILLSACAGQTGQVASTSTVDTLATSSLPAGTGPLQAVIPDQPLLAQGSVEGADYLFVSAAVSVEEAVHAYIIGFRENESRVMVMSWSEGGGDIRQADPGVDGLDLDLNHPGPMPTSVTQQRDGTWVMHGFGVPTTSGATPIFWRALSDSPTGPWGDPAIVYEVGGPGAWDGAWIDFPNVIVVGGGSFDAVRGGLRCRAELLSPGGGVVARRDHAGNGRRPRPSPRATVRTSNSIRMPRLLAVEEDWLLAFSAITGADEEPPIRLATGQDPMHPSCAGSEVALSVDDMPDSGGIHSYALVRTASGPAMLVESLDEEALGSSVWLIPLLD